MRQLSLLPSGCQVHHSGSILYFDEHRIFYASTLAVYVLNASSFCIEKILSLNHKAITSISVSPHDRNQLAISGADGSVCLWDVDNEEVISRIQMGSSIMLSWNPHSPNHVAIINREGPSKLFNWDVSKDTGNITELLHLRQEGLKFSVARWNPNLDGQIALGCKNGYVITFNYKSKTQKVLHSKDRPVTEVVDLQWDRLSFAYLLVAYQFFVSLWDADSGSEVLLFERQTAPITSVSWMDWTPGNFITSNSKNAFLKVWNASQKQPLESLRFSSSNSSNSNSSSNSSSGDCGVNSLCFCRGQRRMACAGLDGALSVINVQTAQLQFRSEPGHTETIFDCKFSPISPNKFCTASYDATLKIWNTDMKLEKTLYGNGDVIYSMDWSPRGNMVAATSLTGLLTIWDVESGRELARYLHHSKASFCVAWNKLCEKYIATTSADGDVTVIEVDADALFDPHSSLSHHTGSRRKTATSHRENLQLSVTAFRFEHPGGVFGCSWSPAHENVLATGCQDGTVRVFNVAHKGRKALLYRLTGPRMRTFGVHWSPLLPGHIAAGSDDRSIYIWEVPLLPSALLNEKGNSIELSQKQMLSGHTGFVRGMSWNSEHRHLLISGSWDSTVRLWEVDTGTCLYVLHDHVADIYSIVAHPERPFTYLTCSRDTTVRMWELEGVFTLMRMQAAWDGCLDRIIDQSYRAKIENAFQFERQRSKNSSQDDFVFPAENNDANNNNNTSGAAAKDVAGNAGNAGRKKNAGGTDDSEEENDIDSITLKESIQEFKSASQNQYMKSLSPFMAGSDSNKVNASLQLPAGEKVSSSRLVAAATTATTTPAAMRGDKAEVGSSRSEAFVRRVPQTGEDMIANYHKLYAFFSGSGGALEVLDNAMSALQQQQNRLNSDTDGGNININSNNYGSVNNYGSSNGSSNGSGSGGSPLTKAHSHYSLRSKGQRGQVIHESEVLAAAKSDARKLEVAASSAAGVGRRKAQNSSSSDGMAAKTQAAMSYVQTGDFRKFCEIMIDLGEWTTALAVAPSVSLEYWQRLSQSYATHLMTNTTCKSGPEHAIPHLLAIGKDAEAVEFYLRRNDPKRAMIVAKMSEARTDLIPDCSVVNQREGGTQSRAGYSLRTLSLESAQQLLPADSRASVPALVRALSLGEIGADLELADDAAASPRDRSRNHTSHNNSNSNNNNINSPTSATMSKALASRSMDNDGAVRERTMQELEEGRLMVKVVALNNAKQQLEGARPLLAAAQMLAVDDVAAAVELLANNFETDLAFVIASAFAWDTTPLKIELADRCAALNAVDLAVDILQSIGAEKDRKERDKNTDREQSASLKKLPAPFCYTSCNGAEEEIGLLLSRYCNDSTCSRIVSERQLKSQSSWLTRAKEEEVIGSDTDAVIAYIAGRQYSKAAAIGVQVMKKHVREALQLTTSNKRMIRALKYIKASELKDSSSSSSSSASTTTATSAVAQSQFLCYLLWYCAHEAAELGMFRTGADMLRILLGYTKSNSFALAEDDVHFQLFFFLLMAGDAVDAVKVLRSLMQRFNSSSNGSNSSSGSGISSGSAQSEVHSLLRVLQATLLDDLDFESSSARIGEAPAATAAAGANSPQKNAVLLSTVAQVSSSSNNGIWGPNTAAIFQTVEKLCLALSLPNVSQLYSQRRKSWKQAQESRLSLREATGGRTLTVLQGSLLPACNQHLKQFTSCISNRRIQGRAVLLGEQQQQQQQSGCYASINEAVSWRRVFPFSPSMDGKLINI